MTSEKSAAEKSVVKDTGRRGRCRFRRVRSVSPMTIIVPYIMKNRVGAQNMITDRINVARLDKYLKEKQDAGFSSMNYMHVLIAAYARVVSQRPALNRFIRGQRIYTREDIEVSLTIKKEMTIDAPDTVVKISLKPDVTAVDVYKELDRIVNEYRDNPGGGFDDTARILSYIPGLFLKFAVWLLNFMDYFGLIPRFLTGVSPFHCSYFITSMGSLGIPSIFHHLYDFGTCPIFCSFGTRQHVNEIGPDGAVYQRKYIDVNFVLDERICDGYYFASSLRMLKSILRNPWVLDTPPEKVVADAP